MKTLELNQMEKTIAGNDTCAGIGVGASAGFLTAAMLLGPAGLLFAGAAILTLGASSLCMSL